MLGDSVGTLSDCLTDLEQTVQSRRTTPATEASASQAPAEALASVEQTFTHEAERLRDECDRSISGQVICLITLNKGRSLWSRSAAT